MLLEVEVANVMEYEGDGRGLGDGLDEQFPDGAVGDVGDCLLATSVCALPFLTKQHAS